MKSLILRHKKRILTRPATLLFVTICRYSSLTTKVVVRIQYTKLISSKEKQGTNVIKTDKK